MIGRKFKHINFSGIDMTVFRQPDNYTGKAMVSKIGKTNSTYQMQSRRQIVALLESNLATGELVDAGGLMLLIVMVKYQYVKTVQANVIAHGVICNNVFTAMINEFQYDEWGSPIGRADIVIINSIPCRVDQVNGKMREVESGLLETTVMRVYAQRHDELLKGHKAVIDGKIFRVDDINYTEIPGAMIVQLGVWTGG